MGNIRRSHRALSGLELFREGGQRGLAFARALICSACGLAGEGTFTTSTTLSGFGGYQ